MVQDLLKTLDFLCTPSTWPSFDGVANSEDTLFSELQHTFSTLHAQSPPPLRYLLTKPLLVELESARITLLPSFMKCFGASSGTDLHQTYMKEFHIYLEEVQRIIQVFVEDALSTSGLSEETDKTLRDMENKFLWLFKSPKELFQDTAVDFQTPPPLLTPKLVEILTSLLEQQSLAWTEVSS